MPRPSLSVHRGVRSNETSGVSPGLMPRPSLSVQVFVVDERADEDVSPGLMPRPSLSVG